MIHRRRIDRNVVWVLVAGFGLAIILLLGSGFIGIQAADLVESRSAYLLEQHRMSTRLIDEIQGEEAGLSGLFYELTARPDRVNRSALLERLGSYESAVSATLRTARQGPAAERWSPVADAAEHFIAEVRGLLQTTDRTVETPASLYRAHERLVSETSSLVATNYQTAVEEEALLDHGARERMRHSLGLLAVALVLSVACAGITVRVALQMFHRTEWQARELSRLSGHVLETQEQMFHRFSRDLHDEFGQTLTAIEANLAAVPRPTAAVASRIEDCVLLVQDAMDNVRELSQLLRPSVLDDFGLVPSLQWLAETFSQRNGIEVRLDIDFKGRLPGETETHFFRIVQEALTNVARHSGATSVLLRLCEDQSGVRLTVSDNGRGMPASRNRGGLGLIGMRERMIAAGGQLKVESNKNGLTVVAVLPSDGIQQVSPDPRLARG